MFIVWQSIPSFFVIPHSVLTQQARDLADYRWDLIAGKGFSVPLTDGPGAQKGFSRLFPIRYLPTPTSPTDKNESLAPTYK